MDNIQVLTDIYDIEHVIIDRGNGEFTSMTKAHYDELEARREQSGTLS